MTAMQRTFALLITGALFVMVYLLQPILMPFLVGFVLAYLGDPLVDRLEALGCHRTVGVAIVFAIFLSLLAIATLILVPLLVREVNALVREIPALIQWLQQTVSPWLIEHVGVDPFDFQVEDLRERLAGHWQEAGGLVSKVIAEVTSSGFALVMWAANLVLIPVVAFYLLRDWDRLMRSVREMLPREIEPTTVRLVRECDAVLSEFLRGQLLIMLLLGCFYAAGLYLVGLKLSIIIGFVAGAANIVPYLGFFVGITIAGLTAVFQFQDVIHLVFVFAVFMAGQLLEGSVLTPLLVGDRIGLHPVAVIFAVLAGGHLFGFVGVLLALPVAAVVMVFLRHAHERYKQSGYYQSREE